MKLEDWPIDTNVQDNGIACGHADCDERKDRPCWFEGETFGELARSIVEHAKRVHGIELERSGCWYRSRTPDGRVWSESSSVNDYGPVDLDGMEGEELEHFAKRNEIEKTLTYERIEVFTIGVLDPGWKPVR